MGSPILWGAPRATALQQIGGIGEIKLVANPHDAANWVASGAGVTVATSSATTDVPLGGWVGTCIKITPVSGTDYARYRWTMPAALKNTKHDTSWYQRPLSGYTSGDLKVEVYKNSASDYSGSYTEFSLSTDSSGTSSIPNATGKFTTSFDADDADYYEIRIVRTAGTTALNLAEFTIGPGIQLATTTQAGLISTTTQSFSGAKTFTDNTTVGSTLTITASSGVSTITPGSGTSFKLENTSSGGAANAIYPSADQGLDLGTTSRRWSNLFIGDGKVIDFASGSTATCKFDGTGNSVRPSANAGLDLGSSSTRWSTVYYTTLNPPSDANLKSDIRDSDLGLDFITKLRPVSYKWNDHPRGISAERFYGFIAQEVEPLLGDDCRRIVTHDSATGYGLMYTDLIAPLVKAVQEQQKQIKELQEQLRTMKE